MVDAQNLRQQKVDAEKQKRDTDLLVAKQKALLQEEVRNMDKQISDMQTRRAKAQTDLSRLSGV